MKKLFEKRELTFALVWIGIYVVLFSVARSYSDIIGVQSCLIAVVGPVLSIILFIWVKKNKLMEYYGLCRPAAGTWKKCLYYIPLLPIVTVNIWMGARLRYTPLETVFHFFTMFAVGFLEELIFRGFLFNALRKDKMKFAIIISSVTFGMGHIVNLFSGAELGSTLLQLVYAVAAGFVFVYIFICTKSLLICILAHGTLDFLTAFALEQSGQQEIVISLILAVISVAYAVFMARMTKRECRENTL